MDENPITPVKRPKSSVTYSSSAKTQSSTAAKPAEYSSAPQDHDQTMVSSEQRHLGTVYVPRKGKSTLRNHPNQQASSLSNVLSPNDDQKSQWQKEYVNSFKAKNVGQFYSSEMASVFS